MYRVPNEMIHLQFLEFMSTHIIASKKRNSQQLRNISEVAAAYGKKILNGITFPSFYSRVSHQRRAEILDVRATPI